MRKLNVLLLLIPAACSAAAYTASQSGNWSTSSTWGNAGVPQFGDTATIGQYTVTCPSGVTCNLGTVNSNSLTLGDGSHAAGLTINGTLVLRGKGTLNGPFFDCTNAPTVTLGSGGTLDLDENGGASASGFVIPAGTAPCTRFLLGASGDVCTWGTSSPTCPTNVASINNGSSNGVLLLDSGTGYGTSITAWNGVAVTSCGTSSTTVGCYQAEMFHVGTTWAWKQVYLNRDGAFGSNVNTAVASDSVPITIDSTISSGRLAGTDIYFGSICSSGAYSPVFVPACAGARIVTNSLLRNMTYNGVSGDGFTAGATIRDVYWDEQGASDPTLTAANIAGGSWSYVVEACGAATCLENGEAYSSFLAPTADHIYVLGTLADTSATNPIFLVIPSNQNWRTDISLTNAIFDNEATVGNAGHCFLYGSDGAPDSGYRVTMNLITVLWNHALGMGGCGFSQWSSGCPAAPTTSITHLLQPGSPTIGSWYACENAGVVSAPPVLSVFEGNIFYDSSPRTSTLQFGNSMPASQPANVVPPGGIDYNLNYNFVPFVPAPYTRACVPQCTNGGSPYAIPMTGQAPGPHDLPSIPTDPEFNVRNGYTWAIQHNQAGTADGFRQVFVIGGPSAIGANISDLFYYINRGNIPARALWNALPDGTTVGPSQPVMFPRNTRTVTQ